MIDSKEGILMYQKMNSDGINPQTQKIIISAVNQIFEIERKLKQKGDPSNINRNIGKLRDIFSEAGYIYENPLGQPCDETRTDLDATISGSDINNLVVVEVIKPIIRFVVCDNHGKFSTIIQKGIVVVEARKES